MVDGTMANKSGKGFPTGGAAAIVTTLRNPFALNSFLRYHREIGFAHHFLFFDDPADPAIAIAERHPEVTIVRSDEALVERWQKTQLYSTQELIRRHLPSEVMARQALNVEVAITLALERGLDWLLHIDSDELFHVPAVAVPDHFRTLAEQGIWGATYLNHEGVPEQMEMEDCFREVSLFKLNPQQQALGRDVPEAGRDDVRFHYYTNGKSAARLSPKLLPVGVHGFRRLDPQEGSRSVLHADACVLHYPCCGFASFLSKYVTLGRFSDSWFSSADIASSIGSFHLEARNVVLAGDLSAMREFYRQRIMLSDPERTDRLINSGLCRRIFDPARQLAEKA